MGSNHPERVKAAFNNPYDSQDLLKSIYAKGAQGLGSLISQAPTSQQSLADPSVQAARQSQLLTQQLARGRKGSFTAPNPGSLDAAPVTDKTLLGG